MSSKDPVAPENQKEYEEFLKSDLEDYRYSNSRYDAQTFAISGGALGISLTFIKDIVPFDSAIYLNLLYSSQFIFVIILLIAFIGHLLSSMFLLARINYVIAKKFELIPHKHTSPLILNWVIAFLVPIGVFLLVLFCVININNSRKQLAPAPPQEVIIKDGHITIEGYQQIRGDSAERK